ncbi:MAG: haloalkane dehalogenase [Gammaproteobacteria bacterium]|nr:haloalkane dehalogenase [Gammaproteobacteria bacterium]
MEFIQILNLRFLVVLAFVLAGANLANASAAENYKLPHPEISSDFPYESQYVDVMDARIHYVEQGHGDPILFIHGNPTSSYLWRNIIPLVSDSGRAIALDLVGMGKSSKPDIDYTFQDHYAYLEKFIETLGLENITLVIHDWGAALGFEYARRNENNVKGIAFMEGLLPPRFPNYYDRLPQQTADFFQFLKDPILGRQFIIEQNGFIEQVLPQAVNRSLTEIEMTHYREPYQDQLSRKPMFVWPQEVPIEGQPKRNVKALNKIKKFMRKTDLPLLLLYAKPGIAVTSDIVEAYIALIENLETVFVGQGFHYLQEDQPEAIGLAVADWMRRIIKEEDEDTHKHKKQHHKHGWFKRNSAEHRD